MKTLMCVDAMKMLLLDSLPCKIRILKQRKSVTAEETPMTYLKQASIFSNLRYAYTKVILQYFVYQVQFVYEKEKYYIFFYS